MRKQLLPMSFQHSGAKRNFIAHSKFEKDIED
jgi:hypothetical protein